MYNEALTGFKDELKAARFEIQTDVLEKVKATDREQEKPKDYQAHKAEVYGYLQTNIKQLISAYGPKFKTIFD